MPCPLLPHWVVEDSDGRVEAFKFILLKGVKVKKRVLIEIFKCRRYNTGNWRGYN